VAKIIAMLGEKGGSGKSSLAHLLAHGLGSLPKTIDAAVVVTDPADDIHQIPRRYFVADGRDHAHLPAVLQKLDQQGERFVVVVDGAAGRLAVDQALMKVADLILIPTTPAHHDVVRAAKSLERLPEAVAVPNRWPSHPQARQHANKLLDLLPRDRVMDAIGTISKVADLMHPNEYGRAATSLSRPGQAFALEVLHRLVVHPFDLHRRD
jgi:chromosome partitioning protein